MLIAGEWVTGNGADRIEAINPATGRMLGTFPDACDKDVDDAASAARHALTSPAWKGITPAERGKILWRVADLIEQNIDELAELETLDQGKALYVGRWAEIPGAVEQFRFFAGEATKIEGATIPTSIAYQPEGKRVFAYTRKEPVGVVAAIVPWNSPLILTAMKLAPALAAGCTIVLKPAEDTSLTALRLGELMIEAGLPAGVVNIVTGRGATAGAALAAHPDVDKVTFTGSTATGRAILSAATGNLKKISLELGGKSPVIILPDADIEAAIAGAANAIFFNGGQVCVAGSRLYAHRSIYERVVEGVSAIGQSIKLGNGLDPETQMGPLVSRTHAGKVAGFINRAGDAGARVVCGGEVLGDCGTFISPCVLADVHANAEVMKEEVFGPVLACTSFDDIQEVIAQANDSAYGLAASVWTEALSNAHRVAADLLVGMVWINGHSYFDPSLPIGGIRQSGWGRDSGRQAVDNYLETKTVCAII